LGVHNSQIISVLVCYKWNSFVCYNRARADYTLRSLLNLNTEHAQGSQQDSTSARGRSDTLILWLRGLWEKRVLVTEIGDRQKTETRRSVILLCSSL
jgi:hypothetical protein